VEMISAFNASFLPPPPCTHALEELPTTSIWLTQVGEHAHKHLGWLVLTSPAWVVGIRSWKRVSTQ